MSAAGRVVEVDVDRLAGWVARFAERHGALSVDVIDGAVLRVSAVDGARADVAIPYASSVSRVRDVAELTAHILRPRTIGLFLVRRGGWAAGVVIDGALAAAETGGGYVQGKTKAGGWSQQRYARRRANQTQAVWERAADGAAGVLLPHRAALDALVTGGDRVGVAEVLTDSRLAGLRHLVDARFFAVGDPRRSVLDEVVRRLRTVVITLNELA